MIAVVPGSFDPITNGHVDIIKRASQLFDEIIVVVGANSSKNPMFTLEERVEIAKESLLELKNVVVESTDKLVVSYAKERGASVIIKGLRDQADFTYEHELEGNNKFIDPSIETIYLAATKMNVSTRSSSIKEFVYYGVDVSALVPGPVVKAIEKKVERLIL